MPLIRVCVCLGVVSVVLICFILVSVVLGFVLGVVFDALVC